MLRVVLGLDTARVVQVPGDRENNPLALGESKPSLTEHILGDVTDRVIDQSSEPLLIVRDH
ncbi:hypothetical protein [Salinibaculum rarum]|uniref:hypothetical protein n=1 Tax=Salinibaculum rarum TaxID=3058903 RepID=UPI00265ECE4A|nr:hypothetical protein [Salinibaculum sp. KK48]